MLPPKGLQYSAEILQQIKSDMLFLYNICILIVCGNRNLYKSRLEFAGTCIMLVAEKDLCQFLLRFAHSLKYECAKLKFAVILLYTVLYMTVPISCNQWGILL